MQRPGAGSGGPQRDRAGPAAAKARLRRRLCAQRSALGPLARAVAGAAIARALGELSLFRRASAVVSYLAADGEVPTGEIHERWLVQGRSLFLPSIHPGAAFVAWRPGEPLGRKGRVQGPLGGGRLERGARTVVLLPLVAWSPDGWRLGRGGGFYDRALAARDPDFALIGLAYEFQRVSHPLAESWDVPVDYVVTERRIVACAAAGVPWAAQRPPCSPPILTDLEKPCPRI